MRRWCRALCLGGALIALTCLVPGCTDTTPAGDLVERSATATAPPSRLIVTVPNVVGMSEAQATGALQAANISVGGITTGRSTRPPGVVSRQFVAPGTRIEASSAVGLEVSGGPAYESTDPTTVLRARTARTKQVISDANTAVTRLNALIAHPRPSSAWMRDTEHECDSVATAMKALSGLALPSYFSASQSARVHDAAGDAAMHARAMRRALAHRDVKAYNAEVAKYNGSVMELRLSSLFVSFE